MHAYICMYACARDTEAGEPPLLKNVVVLSDARSAGAPPITAVAHTLTVREKWIFLATNVAYMIAALFIFWAPEIPTVSTACLGGLCASSAFHGSVVAGLACMSTYRHGAQCHLVEWLYCRRADGSAVLHSAAWMKRLMVCDIFCSLSLVVIGTCCFGALRTLSWIGPSFGVFLWSHQAKRRRQFRAYAFAHGLWHVLSSVSIVQIALNPSPLGPWRVLGWTNN